MQWRGSLAALFIAMGCVSKKEMTVDLNRLILGKSYNSTKVFRTAQHVFKPSCSVLSFHCLSCCSSGI